MAIMRGSNSNSNNEDKFNYWMMSRKHASCCFSSSSTAADCSGNGTVNAPALAQLTDSSNTGPREWLHHRAEGHSCKFLLLLIVVCSCCPSCYKLAIFHHRFIIAIHHHGRPSASVKHSSSAS